MGDDELWKAFTYEVNDQLEHLEKELIHTNSNDLEKLNQVFRYFHSIKSSCAMFELTAMEEIAHAAENILDQVRKGLNTLNEKVMKSLLVSVDCLKDQLAETESTNSLPVRKPDVLQTLESCFNNDTPKPFFNPDDEKNSYGLDSDMLEEFSEITAIVFEKLLVSITANDNEGAINALRKWLRASNALELGQLSAELTQFINLIEAEKLQDRSLAIKPFNQIMDQLHILEEISEQDFELNKYVDHFLTLFGDIYKLCLQHTETVFSNCLIQLNDVSDIAEEDLEYLCLQNDELLKYFNVFNFKKSFELFRYFTQVCRKTLLKQIKFDKELFAKIYGLFQEHKQALGNHEQQLVVDQECSDCLLTFRESLTKTEDQLFGREQRLISLTMVLDIPSNFLDALNNAEIEELENCVTTGKTTAIVIVDLEANHDWSNKFLFWLNESKIITSRTIFAERNIDGKKEDYTKTSFLLVFDKPSAEVKQDLYALDKNSKHIESFVFKLEKESTVDSLNEPEIQSQINAQKIEKTETKSIRIGSDVIDRFVVQVGEMVLQRNMLSHVIKDQEIDSLLKKCKAMLGGANEQGINQKQIKELKDSLTNLTDIFDGLVAANNRLTHSVSVVQEEVMSLRVVPVSMVFNRLPRIIRVINSEYDKNIQLHISGEEVRVDKSMIDVLMEPLVHLVRNCADHGLETVPERESAGKHEPATIRVSAEHIGSVLYIKVADNGRGLNLAKIREKAIHKNLLSPNAILDEEQLKNLIFTPGFSTSEVITEISGRGVGMDAVKTSLASIGGSISIQTKSGEGTTFVLRLPVSAAIQGVVVFKHQEETLAIPERNVVFGLTVPTSEFQSVQGQATVVYQGDIIPVFGINELLNWTTTKPANGVMKTQQDILIVTDEQFHMGLAVDRVVGRQDIFVRELHKDLMSLPGVGGASILGNGDVVLILNCESIMKIARDNAQNIETLLKVS